MQKLNEALDEITTTKCSSDKDTAAASSTTLPQRAEHSHSHLRSSAAPKENMQRGLSTKVALTRLHEEIEKVLHQHEKEHDTER